MPNNDTVKVARYCPECKSRVSAAEPQFAKPQVCPKCKTRVLFVDYLNVKPELPAELELFVESGNPLTRPKLQIILLLAVTGLIVGFIAAVASGITIAMFAFASLILLFGLSGVAYWLDHASKTNAVRQAYKELSARAEQLHGRQTSMVQHFHGMQQNLEQLIEAEKSLVQQQHSKLLDDAAADRQVAAEELSNVQAKVAVAMDDAKDEIASYEKAAAAIATKYLTEVRRSIKSKLNSNNYHKMLETYEKAVEFCGKKGYPVDADIYETVKAELKQDYAEAVRKDVQKAEQARIREQIKEEQKAERELEREMKRIAAEQKAVEKALEEALARTSDEHSSEVGERCQAPGRINSTDRPLAPFR